jgi:prepilin-type N-terminal cleavage/methylation domain-containing protein
MLKRAKLGFTLVELLVVIAITGVLIAVLLPALSKSRDTALNTKCLSNLRSISVADAAYREDWKRWFCQVSNYVEQLAPYTNTDKKFYTFGYGNAHLMRQAHPFKCPLVTPGSIYDGPYGVGMKVIFGAAMSDYAPNTALHFNTVSWTNRYITLRRDSELVHSPSEVLNFTEAVGGVSRVDYSTFSADFRHNQFLSMPMLYLGGNASVIPKTGIVLAGTTFNRNANNTIVYPDRPYFWF